MVVVLLPAAPGGPPQLACLSEDLGAQLVCLAVCLAGVLLRQCPAMSLAWALHPLLAWQENQQRRGGSCLSPQQGRCRLQLLLHCSCCAAVPPQAGG
jgi:hypothetical protein